MIINNTFQNTNFRGFKDFVEETELSSNETKFTALLRERVKDITDAKNGTEPLYETDRYIPPEEIQKYDLIDVYGDIYRDTNNKNEVFLKLRIKPTPAAIDIIKQHASDEKAKEELTSNPLITEFVSQPMAIRSRSTHASIFKNLEDKIAFFKRYILGTATWKTSTKDLLKSSDKPKFGWDRDLIDDYDREASILRMTKAINSLTRLNNRRK